MSALLQISVDLTYQCRADVIVTDLQDELVLLDPGSVEMFSLNAVGRAVWLALPTSPAHAAEQIVAAFDVDEDTALEDTMALLQELYGAGLVESA